ncbi:hypothetical protein BKA80DRAFT_31921 [Phyllosticta citrichinensis]
MHSVGVVDCLVLCFCFFLLHMIFTFFCFDCRVFLSCLSCVMCRHLACMFAYERECKSAGRQAGRQAGKSFG